MKKVILIWAFSGVFLGGAYGAKGNQGVQPPLLNNETKIDSFQKVIPILIAKNDSITERLKYLEIKNGLFDTEMKSLTAIYAVFIAFAFTINYFGVGIKLQSERKEITSDLNMRNAEQKREIEGLISKLEKEFRKLESDHNETAKRLAANQGNTYVAIANSFEKEGKMVLALRHYLNAAVARNEQYQLSKSEKKEKTNEALIFMLKRSNSILEGIEKRKEKITVMEGKKAYLDTLDDLAANENSQVKDLMAEIRVKINKTFTASDEQSNPAAV